MNKYVVLTLFAILFTGGILNAQEKTIIGVVKDLNGPLPGASVFEKGTNNGVITDFEGNFTITVANDNAVLLISFMGYRTQEHAVTGKTSLNIVLEDEAETLGEVVVTAQGIKKSKKALGYAITNLKSKLSPWNREY